MSSVGGGLRRREAEGGRLLAHVRTLCGEDARGDGRAVGRASSMEIGTVLGVREAEVANVENILVEGRILRLLHGRVAAVGGVEGVVAHEVRRVRHARDLRVLRRGPPVRLELGLRPIAKLVRQQRGLGAQRGVPGVVRGGRREVLVLAEGRGALGFGLEEVWRGRRLVDLGRGHVAEVGRFQR